MGWVISGAFAIKGLGRLSLSLKAFMERSLDMQVLHWYNFASAAGVVLY